MRKTERSTLPSDLVAQREEKPGLGRGKSNRRRQRRCCGTTLATPLRLQHSVAAGKQPETVPEIQRRARVTERRQPALRHSLVNPPATCRTGKGLRSSRAGCAAQRASECLPGSG